MFSHTTCTQNNIPVKPLEQLKIFEKFKKISTGKWVKGTRGGENVLDGKIKGTGGG
jgi:hypothetical protein